MSGENQIDVAELERLTNEEEGYVPEQTTEVEPEQEPPQAQTEEPAPNTESQKVVPETPVAESKSVSPLDEITSKITSETPFKSVDDVIKGYKSSQSEITKYIERVKPYEQLINDFNQDQNLRQFIDQAVQLYRNPQLAQAYQQPQQSQGGQPNPAMYDLYTPEGIAQFQADTVAYAERNLDSRLDTRLSAIEQRARAEQEKLQVEQAKFEFKQKYPDQNPDDIIKFVQERGGKWNLEDAYKIANYDKLKEQIYEQARKEISTKVNEASKNQPVSSPANDKPNVSPAETVDFVRRYGLESANKKWGADKVKFAIQKFTEENDF